MPASRSARPRASSAFEGGPPARVSGGRSRRRKRPAGRSRGREPPDGADGGAPDRGGGGVGADRVHAPTTTRAGPGSPAAGLFPRSRPARRSPASGGPRAWECFAVGKDGRGRVGPGRPDGKQAARTEARGETEGHARLRGFSTCSYNPYAIVRISAING